jgi:hypothetical protein
MISGAVSSQRGRSGAVRAAFWRSSQTREATLPAKAAKARRVWAVRAMKWRNFKIIFSYIKYLFELTTEFSTITI